MTEILAVFRSRAQAMDCEWKLKMNGIAASLVNTPKEANIGCGLSVRIPQNTLSRARAIIRSANYSALYGYILTKDLYGRKIIGKI